MTSTNQYDIRPAAAIDPLGYELGRYAFSSTPAKVSPEDKERYLAGREADRLFMSYVDSEPVAKVAIVTMSMNVRGAVLPMGGISGVASSPAARRGGHIRALLQRSFAEMHENGEAVSSLYPFKTAYYEKFGYAGWQAPLWVQFDPAVLAPYMQTPKSGEIRQRLSSQAAADYGKVLAAAQQSIHGMSLFNRAKQDSGYSFDRSWLATVHEGDRVVAGIDYRTDMAAENRMIVNGVFWNTPNGRLNILDFLARHADHMQRIHLPLLPGEQPHLWATHQGNLEIVTNDPESWGPPMARIVQVSGLSGIGAGNGAVSLTVTDAHAPWNNGTFTFTGANGALEVHEGGEPAGEITIHGLAALVFSGIDARTLPVRGWGSVTDDAADALAELFPPAVPFIHEKF